MSEHTGISISVKPDERDLLNELEQMMGLPRKQMILLLVREKLRELKK